MTNTITNAVPLFKGRAGGGRKEEEGGGRKQEVRKDKCGREGGRGRICECKKIRKGTTRSIAQRAKKSQYVYTSQFVQIAYVISTLHMWALT